jgi:hypothetical protein
MSRRQPAYSVTGNREEAGIIGPHNTSKKRFTGTHECLQENPNLSNPAEYTPRFSDGEYRDCDGTSRRQPPCSVIGNGEQAITMGLSKAKSSTHEAAPRHRGTVSTIRCTCKGLCDSRRCGCRRLGKQCTVSCHGEHPCENRGNLA